jgi:hypothetical protein
MATKGRLRRCFPGPAIALDHSQLDDSTFCEALAQLLTSLDVNTPMEVWPVVVKAQTKIIEIRDTVHPKFITEMLIGMLRGIGRPYDAYRIHKRTREDVLWKTNLKPWRRSPLWLLLRVALQTSLAIGAEDHRDYKSFMVFFMAYVLRLALNESASSDTLFLMAAKITRRTIKLELEDQQPGMQYIHSVVEATHQILAQRWCSVEQSSLELPRAWNATGLSFNSDTQLSLLNLRRYLDSIETRTSAPLDVNNFMPMCPPRIDWYGEYPPLDRLMTHVEYPYRLSLLDLDFWVQKRLNVWLTTNLTSPTACTLLAGLIKDYTDAAADVYVGNPEDTSLMLLTAMDLWVALDKCATHQYPLLRDYGPGFPHSLFDPLLLPKRAQMERLNRIEKHIQQRRDASRHPSSLIFQETNESESFAVQYFNQSDDHKMLRREIEAAATVERDKKKAELIWKTQEHRSLLKRFDSMSHDEGTRWNGYRLVPEHPTSCLKCKVKRDADDLEIMVHEWPLPYIELEARSAVFELKVPEAIAKWRDTTFTLLEDCFSSQNGGSPSRPTVYSLRSDSGLSEYIASETSRLQLMSQSKPFVMAHYCYKKIPQANEENICVKNGLHYSIYDTKSGQWTLDLLNRCDVREVCTFQLPHGSHSALSYALKGTTRTSNEAIARQADCPRDLNMHEFYAFTTLRSGHRLQWRNIIRELTTRILDFSREETYLLIVQAAWQAECSHDTEVARDSHVDLEEVEFGLSLLSTLEDSLQTVEGNWQGAMALRTFVVLATRLLSLSPHDKVHKRCYLFLKEARRISLQWTRELGQLLHEEQDVEELRKLNSRVLEMALICHGTFDVDEIHLSTLLQSSEDVAIVIECCITIHDRCPATTKDLSECLKTLLQRFERLSHLLEKMLRSKILQDRSGIDSTILRVWTGYRPGCSWTALSEPNERWLTSQTSSDGGFSSICVHYNVLDGSLLVNGSPLTRLPRSYELHVTYLRIFGEVDLLLSF